MADETPDKNDEGITAKFRDGIRLPKSMANAMAPASVWLMYAIALAVVILALSFGIARIMESLK